MAIKIPKIKLKTKRASIWIMKRSKKLLALILSFICIFTICSCDSISEEESLQIEETLSKKTNTIFGKYESNSIIKSEDVEKILINAGGRLFETEDVTLSDKTKVKTQTYIFSVENFWVAFFDSSQEAEKHFDEIYTYTSDFSQSKGVYHHFSSAVKLDNVLIVGGYNSISLVLENYVKELVLPADRFTEQSRVEKCDVQIDVSKISSQMKEFGYTEYKSTVDNGNVWWGFVNFDTNELCVLMKLSDGKTERFANELKNSSTDVFEGVSYMYSGDYVLISRVGVWKDLLGK